MYVYMFCIVFLINGCPTKIYYLVQFACRYLSFLQDTHCEGMAKTIQYIWMA